MGTFAVTNPTADGGTAQRMGLVVDTGFFLANLVKIAEGGWLPLTFAAILFAIMVTWRTGVDAIRAALVQSPEAGERSSGSSRASPRCASRVCPATRY